jgi:hypothetical protein
MGNDVERNVLSLASAWSKSGKPRRTLHRVVGVLAKIQIERLANTSEATPF